MLKAVLSDRDFESSVVDGDGNEIVSGVSRGMAKGIAGLDLLLQAARALPIDQFYEDPSQNDAANFVDNAAAFMKAMSFAKEALAITDTEEHA